MDNSFEIAQYVFDLEKRIEKLEGYRASFVATMVFAILLFVASIIVFLLCIYEYDKHHVK